MDGLRKKSLMLEPKQGGTAGNLAPEGEKVVFGGVLIFGAYNDIQNLKLTTGN